MQPTWVIDWLLDGILLSSSELEEASFLLARILHICWIYLWAFFWCGNIFLEKLIIGDHNFPGKFLQPLICGVLHSQALERLALTVWHQSYHRLIIRWWYTTRLLKYLKYLYWCRKESRTYRPLVWSHSIKLYEIKWCHSRSFAFRIAYQEGCKGCGKRADIQLLSTSILAQWMLHQLRSGNRIERSSPVEKCLGDLGDSILQWWLWYI